MGIVVPNIVLFFSRWILVKLSWFLVLVIQIQCIGEHKIVGNGFNSRYMNWYVVVKPHMSLHNPNWCSHPYISRLSPKCNICTILKVASIIYRDEDQVMVLYLPSYWVSNVLFKYIFCGWCHLKTAPRTNQWCTITPPTMPYGWANSQTKAKM